MKKASSPKIELTTEDILGYIHMLGINNYQQKYSQLSISFVSFTLGEMCQDSDTKHKILNEILTDYKYKDNEPMNEALMLIKELVSDKIRNIEITKILE